MAAAGAAQQQPAAAPPGGAPPAPTAFLRKHLLQLAPYTPIEPFEILSARYGRAPGDIVKLDANENPYGPPPEVREALAAMPFPHIYPDPETRRLRAALAEWTGVPMEHLLVGCGADELIDLLMRCTLEPGDAIVDCPPTFTMYAFDAAVNDARVVTVPRLPGFATDVEGIRRAVAEHAPKIVFLTSPNNPDGSVISDADLRAVLALPVLVVLDEAYIEFATDLPSRMAWVAEHPNLVVLRTFSKCAALAGLRVGYGAFPLGMIEYLWRAKQPYNVSVAAEVTRRRGAAMLVAGAAARRARARAALTRGRAPPAGAPQVAACAALTNQGYLDTVRDALLAERARLFAALSGVPWLEPFPSNANFILCKVDQGRDAKEVKDALARSGIMVRHYAKAELSGYIRISVGKPEHTDALMAAINAL
ncbi:HISN6B [Scenedesmus sp. PABB004]|nr:HISN6B [Scenedesmus sp. PABB004]